jgi:DNA-binding MarR family transcriptional regulator
MQVDSTLSIRQYAAMTTTTETNRARAAVTELILEVFRLNGQLLAAGDALVADIGLTSARWQVLGAIALSPVPLPVAHLARNMGLARQSVQRLVGEMNDDGLVEYAPNQHHRRARLVLLTDNGEIAFRAAIARQEPWADGLAAGLTAEAIRTATGTLRRLRRHLEDGMPDVARQHDLHPTEGADHDGVHRDGHDGHDP